MRAREHPDKRADRRRATAVILQGYLDAQRNGPHSTEDVEHSNS